MLFMFKIELDVFCPKLPHTPSSLSHFLEALLLTQARIIGVRHCSPFSLTLDLWKVTTISEFHVLLSLEEDSSSVPTVTPFVCPA